FGLLMLIMLGEGFFKLVVTLADKGIYKVETGTLVNVVMGGLSLFALAWIYFDSAGNAKPKSRDNGVLVAYWLAHIAILWSAVVVGVALAGEVYVGFWEPYPTGYGALGTVGLAVFLGALWVLQGLVADRDRTCHYHSGGVLLFGIAVALLVLVIHPFVPAIVGNALWGLALFSQIGVPVYRGLRDQRLAATSGTRP
ncbi:MAG: low temperature requirement protein A, partial [Algiphilus sp.]